MRIICGLAFFVVGLAILALIPPAGSVTTAIGLWLVVNGSLSSK